ncbi:MAG: PKD domain-containing protein, partial [Aliifodinibius sp.]|nr:PKD domain-containing protein [candidate division Zixibacteria bacterium]NIT56356.1 PKD domain-containing protein [Fodinibius sp.]NIW44437.1 PKD domain-containing protein [Gammaproteobacteria bacterium]NIS45450.1 PKD domain-containing protein [candidate division Zixibacteria bacterium]NIU13590.1 PKD domain-containing protein [candidate division Zixibacteria bacterium]
MIGGTPVWQIRNVSAQNSFNGHNSHNVHFGLGDATVVDSLEITWPSGDVKVMTSVNTDQFLTVTEDIPSGFLHANFTADSIQFINQGSATVNFRDLSVTDPNSPITSREWDFNNDGIIDSNDPNPSWTYSQPGSYTVTLSVSNGVNTESQTRTDYIFMTGLVPIIDVNTLTVNLGMIDVNTPRVDTTFYVHNNGGAMDSIMVTLDPDNVNPPSAVSVTPTEFELAPGDSQAVTFTVFPSDISPNGPFMTPKVIIDSR